MKKFKFSSRVLAFVLAFVMIASLLPLSTLAAVFDVVTESNYIGTGIDTTTLNKKGTINWPVKIYDHLADGMLFEFSQQNSKEYLNTSPKGSVSGDMHGGQYVLGQPMPYAQYCTDYTADVEYSEDGYNLEYNTNNRGKRYTRTAVAAVDYVSPRYLSLKYNSANSSANRNYELTCFYRDYGGYIAKASARYMVVVYRASGLANGTVDFLINTNGDNSTALSTAGYYRVAKTLKNSSVWIYEVFDLQSIFSANWGNFTNLYETFFSINQTDTAWKLDISHIGYFSTSDAANTYGQQCLAFNAEPGEYIHGYGGLLWNPGNNTGFGMFHPSNNAALWSNTTAGGAYNTSAGGAASTGYYTHRIGYAIPDYGGSTASNAARKTGKDANGRFNGSGTEQGENGIYYITSSYYKSTQYQTENPGATYFDMSKLKLGYTLFGQGTEGGWTAGLLQNKLGSDGTLQYKQETVEYIADMLSKTLTIPQYASSDPAAGYPNYNFVAGVKNRAQFGYSTVNGKEVPNDLAQALRNLLNIYFTKGQSKGSTPKMGTYEETLAKADKLKGSFRVVAGMDPNSEGKYVNQITSCMDAAYYLLHNTFVANSYNQVQDDFSYLTLSSAVTDEGEEVYIFDGGFSQGAEIEDLISGKLNQTQYKEQTQSAVEYDGYNKPNGSGTISHSVVNEKDYFYYSNSGVTTKYPFLPVVDADENTVYEGQTDSYYFAEDGKRSFYTEHDTYYGRNFNYTMVSNGEFVYHKDDNLFFEFEGDDDVYLFINGELVLDIGGGHSVSTCRFNVNDYVNWAEGVLANPTAYTETDVARANALKLEDGEIASFDFYYMERHGYGANCRIVTNMHITDPSLRVEKKAYQAGKEIEFGGLVDGATPIEYRFVANNGGNTKLYNFTFDDADIGVSLTYENGLTVKEGNNKYIVSDARMEELDAQDLTATVRGYKKVGTGGDYDYEYLTKTYNKVAAGTGEFIYAEAEVTFTDNEALKRFLRTLEANTTDTSPSDEELTQTGSGLWKDASLEIGGIYYTMTDTQRDEGLFENRVYVTATSKANLTDNGCETKRSDDNHRVYITAIPAYYQWKDHELFMSEARIFDDASRESGNTNSMLYDYHEFFTDVVNKANEIGGKPIDCIVTCFCDKDGNYLNSNTAYEHVKTTNAKDGTFGFKADYDTTGIHEFYIHMHKYSGAFGDEGKDAYFRDFASLKPNEHAVIRVIVIVSDTKDATYVLDYGLKTENLDTNGILFKDDELLGKLGGTEAKLMGINTTGGSYAEVSQQKDFYNRLDFEAMPLDAHNQIYVNGADGKTDGLYTFNMNIDEDGKEITYNAVSGLYSLTDSGTTTVHAEVPTNWEELKLYYRYDDGRNNGWPGEDMTRTSWGNFSINIPGNVPHIVITATTPDGETKQSVDLTINPGHEVWIDFGDGTSMSGDKYLAEAKYKSREGIVHTTVPEDWGDVYYYCWDAFGNGLEAWPGTKVEAKDANGYYTFEIPGDITNVIINNGDNGKQSFDLVVFAGEETWITVDNEPDNSYDNKDYYNAKTSRSQESVTFHATVPDDWESAFFYYWNSNNSSTKVTWPGLEMTKDANGVYYLENVPADVNNVIINNGGKGKQTVDLLVTPGLETWISVNDINTTQSLFITAPADWEDVNVYFFNDNGDVDESWPGKSAINLYGNQYFITVPFGATKYIVNNNNNGQQTQDLLLIPGKDTRINAANQNAQAATSSKVTITAPDDWTTLNVYAWNGGTNAKNAEWPGVAVEKNSDGKFVYTLDKNFNKFIINGNGVQTSNIEMFYMGDETLVTVYADGGYTLTSPTATDNKFTANIAYGVDAEQEGFSFTPLDFMDSEYSLYMALTVHEVELARPTALGNDINIGKEVQMMKKVTVLPASVVYYEDDFAGIKYNYTTGNVVTHYSEGSGSLSQSIDQNQQYGNDNAYQTTDNGEMTGGSLTDVYINNTNEFARFSFTGTGFEVIGHTHAVNSGTLLVEVYDKEGTRIKRLPVISEFDNGADGGKDTVASFPLIRVSGLEYGEYTVKLSGVPVYDFSNWTDKTQAPPVAQSYLCIDGFRVYQPLKGTNTRNLLNLDTLITVSTWDNSHFADPADGIIVEGNNWEAGDWFGFKQGLNVDEHGQGVFSIDLGDIYTITDLRAHVCSTFQDASIGNPQWIEIYYANKETEQFKCAGTLDVTAQPGEIYWAEWKKDNGVSEFDARYLKFKFGPGWGPNETRSTWVLVDEVEVHGHETVGGHDQYIKEESSATFTEVRNLIAERQAFAIKYDDTNGLSVSGGTSTWTENRNNVRPSDHNTKWVNNTVNSIADYLLAGPNNEVYVMESTDAEKTAIAFYVTESDKAEASTRTMQIGIRAMDYNSFVGELNTGKLNAEIQYAVAGEGGEIVWRTLTTSNSSAEQYFTIPYTECPYDANLNRYQVVLRVADTNPTGMASFTTLKHKGIELLTLNESEIPDVSYGEDMGNTLLDSSGNTLDSSKFTDFIGLVDTMLGVKEPEQGGSEGGTTTPTEPEEVIVGTDTSAMGALYDTFTKDSNSNFGLRDTSKIYIVTDSEANEPSDKIIQTAQLAQQQFASDTSETWGGCDMQVVWGLEEYATKGDIIIRTGSTANGDEGYKLTVTDRAVLECKDERGLLYGINTLQKHFRAAGTNAIKGFTIVDAPDTKERAVHLDCARKYLTPEAIKNYIAEMSWMGYNAIELHMSEDGGFRMDFWGDKALSEVPGMTGNDFSWVCGSNPAPWVFTQFQDSNGKVNDKGKYLTTEEVIEICETAKEYNIEIIPSFDTPAHVGYMTELYYNTVKANSNSPIRNFTYKGTNYTLPTQINYREYTGSTDTRYDFSVLDLSNTAVKNFAYAMYNDIAAFFKYYSGSDDFNIGADEVGLISTDRWNYNTHFVNYVNDVNNVLKSYGYKTRMYNDFLYNTNYSSITTGISNDIGVVYWLPTSSSRNYLRSASFFANQGRQVYSGVNFWTYYVLRIAPAAIDKNTGVHTNAGIQDARDPNNRQWEFYRNQEDHIYNEWNASQLGAYTDSNKGAANNYSGDKLAGAYFMIWNDFAGLNTEVEVWNGCYNEYGTNNESTGAHSGNGQYYSMIERMWSSGIKQWNADINSTLSFKDFESLRDEQGFFPGYVATPSTEKYARAMNLPAKQEVEGQYRTYHTVTFKNWDGTVLQTVSVKEGTDAVYTAATPTREADVWKTYTFSGWDKELTNITGPTTVIAQFSEADSAAGITGYLELKSSGGSNIELSVDNAASKPVGLRYTNKSMKFGKAVTVKAITNNNDYEFIGWVNAKTGEIASTSETYSFYTSGNDVFIAMYAVDDAEGKSLVTFKNDKTNQIIDMQYFGTNDIGMMTFPNDKVADYPGYEHTGWDHTEAQILAAVQNGENITITTTWTAKAVYFKVAVNNGSVTEFISGGVDDMYRGYKAITVTADKAPAGEKFAYWTDEQGRIVSYKEAYKMFPHKNTELTAVYVPSSQTVSGIVSTAYIDAQTLGDANTVFFSWDATTSEYDIMNTGVLLAKKQHYYADTFKVGTINENVLQFVPAINHKNSKTGSYSVTLPDVLEGETWVAMSFVQYRDSSGIVRFVYSELTEATK